MIVAEMLVAEKKGVDPLMQGFSMQLCVQYVKTLNFHSLNLFTNCFCEILNTYFILQRKAWQELKLKPGL